MISRGPFQPHSACEKIEIQRSLCCLHNCVEARCSLSPPPRWWRSAPVKPRWCSMVFTLSTLSWRPSTKEPQHLVWFNNPCCKAQLFLARLSGASAWLYHLETAHFERGGVRKDSFHLNLRFFLFKYTYQCSLQSLLHLQGPVRRYSRFKASIHSLSCPASCNLPSNFLYCRVIAFYLSFCSMLKSRSNSQWLKKS